MMDVTSHTGFITELGEINLKKGLPTKAVFLVGVGGIAKQLEFICMKFLYLPTLEIFHCS